MHKQKHKYTIVTTYDPPPIPIRGNDWVAFLDGQEEDGIYGYGQYESDAICDLVSNLEMTERLKG